jgi:hypothetical protein
MPHVTGTQTVTLAGEFKSVWKLTVKYRSLASVVLLLFTERRVMHKVFKTGAIRFNLW